MVSYSNIEINYLYSWGIKKVILHFVEIIEGGNNLNYLVDMGIIVLIVYIVNEDIIVYRLSYN